MQTGNPTLLLPKQYGLVITPQQYSFIERKQVFVYWVPADSKIKEGDDVALFVSGHIKRFMATTIVVDTEVGLVEDFLKTNYRRLSIATEKEVRAMFQNVIYAKALIMSAGLSMLDGSLTSDTVFGPGKHRINNKEIEFDFTQHEKV